MKRMIASCSKHRFAVTAANHSIVRCKYFLLTLRIFAVDAANSPIASLFPKKWLPLLIRWGIIPLNMALTARTMSTKKHSLIEIGLAGSRHAVFFIKPSHIAFSNYFFTKSFVTLFFFCIFVPNF